MLQNVENQHTITIMRAGMLEYALLVSYPGEMPVLGSVKVVVLELWSTKYGIPSLVCLISQPEGRGVSEPTILKNNKTKI